MMKRMILLILVSGLVLLALSACQPAALPAVASPLPSATVKLNNFGPPPSAPTAMPCKQTAWAEQQDAACGFAPAAETPQPAQTWQLQDFDFLESGISYEEITARLGESAGDIGSGLHIFTYPLADGTCVYLQFASLDALLGAGVMDAEGNMVLRLVGD